MTHKPMLALGPSLKGGQGSSIGALSMGAVTHSGCRPTSDNRASLSKVACGGCTRIGWVGRSEVISPYTQCKPLVEGADDARQTILACVQRCTQHVRS